MKNKHPYIICHMMTSLDGKIASGEEVDVLDDFFGLYTQTEDEHKCNAYMCGRKTMEMFASKDSHELPESSNEEYENIFISDSQGYEYFFGVDTKGVLRWNSNKLKLSNVEENINLVIITTKNTPKQYLAYLRSKDISYIIAGVDSIDFELLFSIIYEKFGVQKLLLEGGGIINGLVLSSGFIDEISLLLTPIVVNRSKAPSLFESDNESEISINHFELISLERTEKDCVWLRYKKT